jgi:hypothetical protein
VGLQPRCNLLPPVHRRRHGRDLQESAGIKKEATRTIGVGIVSQYTAKKVIAKLRRQVQNL